MNPQDLTIILLTINNTPKEWAEYHKKVLLEAAGDYPIIVISKDKMDWGLPNVTHLQQEVPPFEDMWARTCNIYYQILRGAQLATTPYVAIAEDDCLYPREHFTKFRPDFKTFAYNHTRWCMFSWARNRPFYYHMPTDANCLMIAPREYLIEQMKDWTDKSYLEGEYKTRKMMHKLQEPCIYYNTIEPVLCFYHGSGNDSLERSRRKKPWPIQVFEIPKWGKAKHIIQQWK